MQVGSPLFVIWDAAPTPETKSGMEPMAHQESILLSCLLFRFLILLNGFCSTIPFWLLFSRKDLG